MDELIDKLLGSEAVITSKMEADVCKKCLDNNWTALQGIYYKDLTHSKFRELDVSAIQKWKSTSIDNGLVNINILVEVKTMSGYHLIFDNLDSKPSLHFQSNGYCDWVGYSINEQKRKIYDILDIHGVNKALHPEIVDKLSDEAYPDGSVRIRGLIINPSKSDFNAGSFRETNIGSEKELENSVLWKASQSLWSSIESFKHDKFENFLADFDTDVLLARQEDSDSWYTESMKMHSSSASLYHPVIVTGAKLWSINGSSDKLESIGSTRLYIRDNHGHVIRWFDIVNMDFFDTWIKDATKQYTESFIKEGAVRA